MAICYVAHKYGGDPYNIKVAKNAVVVIEGGSYSGSITVTGGGTGSLTIKPFCSRF